MATHRLETTPANIEAGRKYPRVRYHPNGLLDVHRTKGKFSKIAQRNQQMSPLLRLPYELRQTILEIALGNETFSVQMNGNTVAGKGERKKKAYLALSVVSRQIYVESVLLPFQISTFQADTLEILSRWSKNIPYIAMQNIRSIQFSTRISWHAYQDDKRTYKIPTWWTDGSFDQFPALRNVCVVTIMPRCYCTKKKPETDALLKLVGEMENNFETWLESANGAKATFERQINFAPLELSMDDMDMWW